VNPKMTSSSLLKAVSECRFISLGISSIKTTNKNVPDEIDSRSPTVKSIEGDSVDRANTIVPIAIPIGELKKSYFDLNWIKIILT
jgi:hypothetical protein